MLLVSTLLLQGPPDFLGFAVDYAIAISGGDEKQIIEVVTGLFNKVKTITHSTNFWRLIGMY